MYDDRNRSMTPQRPYFNRCSSTANGSSSSSPTSTTDLLEVDPHPFRRVGASIGCGRMAVRYLLEQHVPGVVMDEELGIVAMFREIHQSLARQSANLQDVAHATTASILAAWARIQHSQLTKTRSTLAGLTTSKTSSFVSNAEEDISMVAMFREVRDTVLGTTTTTPCQGVLACEDEAVADGSSTMMDAILANILHAVACERKEHSVVSGGDLYRKDEDFSMAAMFREIASLLPGSKSEQQVEYHMVGRVQEIIHME